MSDNQRAFFASLAISSCLFVGGGMAFFLAAKPTEKEIIYRDKDYIVYKDRIVPVEKTVEKIVKVTEQSKVEKEDSHQNGLIDLDDFYGLTRAEVRKRLGDPKFIDPKTYSVEWYYDLPAGMVHLTFSGEICTNAWMAKGAKTSSFEDFLRTFANRRKPNNGTPPKRVYVPTGQDKENVNYPAPPFHKK